MATTTAKITEARREFRANTDTILYKLVRKGAMKTADTVDTAKELLLGKISFAKARLDTLLKRISATKKNMKQSNVSKTNTAVESAEIIAEM